MEAQATEPAASRSTFVTVLAWIFIVLSGFSTLIALLQNVMIGMMSPAERMPPLTGSGADQVPSGLRFMFEHVDLFFLMFLAVSAITLAAAIGLLLRQNWARVVFIGLLGLGIVWNVVGLGLQQIMIHSMPALPSNTPPNVRAEADHAAAVMLVFSAVFAIGFSVLYAWLIKRLVSAPIRAEFGRTS